MRRGLGLTLALVVLAGLRSIGVPCLRTALNAERAMDSKEEWVGGDPTTGDAGLDW